MLRNKYQRPFWVGLLHAISIVLYVVLISFVWLTLVPLLGDQAMPFISTVLFIFLCLVSLAVVAYFIFFEPFKLIVHHHFKEATVLIMSTFGWLFVCIVIMVLAYISTVYS